MSGIQTQGDSSDSRPGKSTSDEAAGMRAMSIGGCPEDDVDSAEGFSSSSSDTGQNSYRPLWDYSFAELMTGFGVRIAALYVLIKILGLIIFAAFFAHISMRVDPSSSEGSLRQSRISIHFQRPSRLRDMIHQTSLRSGTALIRFHTKHELVYDKYMEFIVSHIKEDSLVAVDAYDRSKTTRSNAIQASSDSDDEGREHERALTATDRSIVTTSRRLDNKIRHAAQLDDVLALDSIDTRLIVHRFDLNANSVAINISTTTNTPDEGRSAHMTKIPYTIALNKYSSITDHCLLLSDEFEAQISPFNGVELELWHWIIIQTNAVGFYNSNILAGASQLHRHMQFLPLDAVWPLRNPDAPHALPIDDVIFPKIESGKWRRFPSGTMRSRESSTGSTGSTRSSTKQSSDNDLRQYLYQLPQFAFDHSIAVLLDRSSFLDFVDNSLDGSADTLSSGHEAYGEYLRSVYQALLKQNNICLKTLTACADIIDPSSSSSNTIEEVVFPRGQTAEVCTQQETAYNLILTTSYMMLVPRSKAEFRADNAGVVNINSFGFLGMLLARTPQSAEAIKRAGPLHVLQSVATDRSSHELLK